MVLGKVSKAIATTMNLDSNALLKSMLTSQDVNDANKIPTASLLYSIRQNLQSQISGKIDTSKIVNNLLSTDASTVLSGAMGKNLADKDANLQSQITQLNGELGTRKATGVIKDDTRRGLYCGMDFSDAPADGWLVLIYCFIESNSTGFCIAFGINGKSEGHIYGFIYSGGWTDYVINFC